MGLSINCFRDRLPRRLPVGAKYVVEGYGGGEGNLRVIARYVVLPGGQRINIAADVNRATPPRALVFRRSSTQKRSEPKNRGESVGKKFALSRGTG
jgi:hypothetical protein